MDRTVPDGYVIVAAWWLITLVIVVLSLAALALWLAHVIEKVKYERDLETRRQALGPWEKPASNTWDAWWAQRREPWE